MEKIKQEVKLELPNAEELRCSVTNEVAYVDDLSNLKPTGNWMIEDTNGKTNLYIEVHAIRKVPNGTRDIILSKGIKIFNRYYFRKTRKHNIYDALATTTWIHENYLKLIISTQFKCTKGE